jgi:hypothetical protein
MLKLSDSFSSVIIQYLVIAKAAKTKDKTRTLHDFGTKVRIATAISMVDASLVLGVSFFSSLIALGYDNLLLNIKISLFSAFTIASLCFFTEMKKQLSNK